MTSGRENAQSGMQPSAAGGTVEIEAQVAGGGDPWPGRGGSVSQA